jgi:hypothetical protein
MAKTPTNIFNRITAKSILAGTKTQHSPVKYIGIVQVSYVSPFSHPAKITTAVAPSGGMG